MNDAALHLFDRIAQLHRYLAVNVPCPTCEAPALIECDTGIDSPHLARVIAANQGLHDD